MREWKAWRGLWRLAACGALCSGALASEPDYDEPGGSPGNPNPCEETGRSCEPGTLEEKEHDGETEFVVCLGSPISPPDISAMAELAGGTLTVQFDGCPDETSAVSYALETRWVPEIPETFGEPGEFTFAAEAMAVSGSPDCSDIPWMQVGEITVTVVKVAIETPPTKICASVESFTVRLTEDSFSGDESINWGGVEGEGNNVSFTFIVIP